MTLVVAPALLIAANFILLRRKIRRLGPGNVGRVTGSPLGIVMNVNTDIIIFVSCTSYYTSSS